MTITAAPRRALPGHCREIGCDLVLTLPPSQHPPVIIHVHAGRVEIYRPSEQHLDDVSYDIWVDVKDWAEGLHG